MTNQLSVCGDAFNLIKEVSDNSVDLVFTDPPYNFTQNQKWVMHGEFTRVIKENGQIIVFSPPENQWILPAEQYGFWIKPISTKNTSKSYSRFVEMIFFYGRGTWNSNRHWSQYTNVFSELVDSKAHPFRKPFALVERIIKNHTHPLDFVLDPFMGSGVVGEVCRQFNRHFLGFEKDKSFFEKPGRFLIKDEKISD